MAAGTAFLPRASGSESALKHGGAWWMLLFVAMAIGLSMRIAGPAAVRAAFDQLKLDSIPALALLLAACAVSMILHECGHLAAALLLHFEVLGGSLGPFRIDRLQGRWQFRILRGSLFRGSVSAVPRGCRHWRAATMIVVAAGPLATLLAGIVSVSAASQSGLHPFWAAMAELNLLLFALSLLPFRMKTAPSDAKLFIDLLRNGPEAVHIARCFRLMRERAFTAADTSRAA
ncbi:MAG: hypothetical protein ACRD4O_14650 [Bryobacteraceae bacterium]